MTVSTWGTDFFSDIDVKNVPVETFNISFESIQNKKHFGTEITCRGCGD